MTSQTIPVQVLTIQSEDGPLRLAVLDHDHLLHRSFVAAITDDQLNQVILDLDRGVFRNRLPQLRWFERWQSEVSEIIQPDLVDALNERMRWRLVQQQRAAAPVA